METSQVRLSQNQWGNWIILPAPTGFSPIFPRTNDEWGLLITAACPCCAYSAAQHSEKTPTVILHHMTRVFPKHISLKSTYIWFPLILHLPHLLLACLGFAAVAPRGTVQDRQQGAECSTEYITMWEYREYVECVTITTQVGVRWCLRDGASWQLEMWWVTTTLSRIGHLYPAYILVWKKCTTMLKYPKS